jgi:hypothetical protein
LGRMSPAVHILHVLNASDGGCSSPGSRAVWTPSPGPSKIASGPSTPAEWCRLIAPRKDGKVVRRVRF